MLAPQNASTTSVGSSAGIVNNDSPLLKAYFVYYQQYRTAIDKTMPYIPHRWIVTLLLLAGFVYRIFALQAFFVVIYALGIYLLNIFLAFLSPKFDPSLDSDLSNDAEEEEDAASPSLPTRQQEEFRPFIRRMPEFKFWYAATRAVLTALFCTLFDFFDIPVFWPILLMYFMILFALTMRRQIKHMIRHNYVPFDLGKKKYQPGVKSNK